MYPSTEPIIHWHPKAAGRPDSSVLLMTVSRGDGGFRLARSDGWVFVALLLGIVAIGEALKVFRAPALLPIVLVAVIYARGSMFRRQHLPLLLLSIWGLIYVFLSYLHAFSPAWTRYYDTGVIFQQASYLAVLLPLVSASQKWWDDPRFDVNREAILIAVVFFAFLFGVALDIAILGAEGVSIRPLATLRNYVLLGLLALSYFAFRSRKWRTFAIAALMLLLAMSIWLHLFLQNTFVYVIILGFLTVAMLRIPADRLMLAVFLLLLISVTLIGIQDPLRVFEIDPNTGWRLAWWRDALEATAQTGGLGVGYGTESLRNEYGSTLLRDTYREEGGTFLLVSTHSAFFDTIFRTGVVGFVLLCVVLARCYPHAHTPPLARAHCCAMFAVMILCLHSNLGLQSPMYSLGVAICIGYLQSERRKAVVAASRAAVDVPIGTPREAASLARQ